MKHLYITSLISILSFNAYAQSPGFTNPHPYTMNQEFVDKNNSPTSKSQDFGLQTSCSIEKKECEFNTDASTCAILVCNEPFVQSSKPKTQKTTPSSPSGQINNNFPGIGSNPPSSASPFSQDNTLKNKSILEQFTQKNKLIGMSIVNFNTQFKNNLPKELNDFTIRVIPFNSMITMDYSNQRININLNENNTIKNLTIG